MPALAVSSFILIATLVCSASAASTHKFQIWFPKYEYHWINASAFCKTELNDYWTQNRSRCDAICACAADCLLDHTTETIKSNMATATVILGLMPGIISLLGPSIAEMSLLSAKYPLLAVLLSFASPAVNLTHLYHAPASPRRVLGTATTISVRKWHTWIDGLPSLVKTAIQVAEYALAGGMLANTVQVSLYVDYRTISGWRCSWMYLPMSWAMSGGLAHLIGIVAIRFRKGTSPKSSNNSPKSLTILAKKRVLRLLVAPSNHWKCIVNSQNQVMSEILFLLASLASILHMVFGVLVFSSLIFVGVLDTLPIVIRYGTSAAICQAILLLELASMRLDIQREEVSGNSDMAPRD
jgi:hypothetical protein